MTLLDPEQRGLNSPDVSMRMRNYMLGVLNLIKQGYANQDFGD